MDNFFYNHFVRLTEDMPNRLTINSQGKKFTYDQLFKKSVELANKLQSYSINRIAIIANHSIEVYLLVFASVLSKIVFSIIRHDKYLPIIISSFDPDLIFYPGKKKLNLNVNRYRIISDISLSNIEIERQSNPNKNTLYISWTSGVTGSPKGVMVSSKGIKEFLKWTSEFYTYDDSFKWGEPTDLYHDLGIVNLFISFFNKIEYVPINGNVDKLFFARFIKLNGITHFRTVPRYIDFITHVCRCNDASLIDSLKFVGFGGDLLLKDKVEELFLYNKNLEIYNTYGATETTGFNSVALFNSKNINRYSYKNRVSIGLPINGNDFHISSDDELIIKNKNLFLGYIGETLIGNNKNVYLSNDLATIQNSLYYIVGRKTRSGKHKGQKISLDRLDEFISIQLNCQVRSIFYNDLLISFIIQEDLSQKKIYDLLKNDENFYNLSPIVIFIDKFEYNENLKIDDNKLIEKNLILINEKKYNKSN